MSQKAINQAATATKRYVLRQAGLVRMPRSEAGWRRLCEGLGLKCRPRKLPWGKTARLYYCIESDEWVAIYNAYHSRSRRMEYLSHELCEYLVRMHGEHRTLFDDEPGSVIYSFDGSDDPGDVCHRIAARFTYLCFPGKRGRS